MRNLSVVKKISITVLVVIAILTIRRISQITGLSTPTANAEGGKAAVRTDSIPSCSSLSSGGHAAAPGGAKPHSVTLSWKASAPASGAPGDTIEGYDVYRSQESQDYANRKPINSTPLNGTQCVDTTVEPRATYYYVIKAVAKSGAQSVVSKEIKAVIPFP
jgi:hypothetical protein